MRHLIEFTRIVRKIERILELRPQPVIPWINIPPTIKRSKAASYIPRLHVYTISILPSILLPDLLEVAIHEIRHRLQFEQKVKLLQLKDVEHLADTVFGGKYCYLKESILPPIEVDAKICAYLGSLLLDRDIMGDVKIEEFKNLMLFSKVPARLPQAPW